MMTDQKTTLAELKAFMKAFVDERDWGQFHSPKNLSMALAVEAAELMEHFLWVEGNKASADAFEKKREEIEHEVADVFALLLALCNQNNIDLSAAYERKMKLNGEKYPVEKSKGSSAKYTELNQNT